MTWSVHVLCNFREQFNVFPYGFKQQGPNESLVFLKGVVPIKLN